MTRKFIVDCDPGLDDARALIILLSAKDIEILCISVVCGNSSIPNMIKNAARTTHALNKPEIPIYPGSPSNLKGEKEADEYFHGSDGFGNCEIDHNPSSIKSDMSGPEAMVHFACKYPGEITLLCMGPLTNLALAYQKDPSITSKFKEFWIMGGNREEKSALQVTQWAEFNFYSDPWAVEIVLNNFGNSNMAKVIVLDWYICFKHQVQKCYFDDISQELAKQGKINASKIFGTMAPGILNYISQGIDCTTFNIPDDIAALVSYNQALIKKSHPVKFVSIQLEGEKRGQTKFKDDENGNIILIDEIDDSTMRTFYKSIVTGK